MIHGLGGSIDTWKFLEGPLSKSYNLLMIDLPGHGDMSVEKRTNLNLSILAEEIKNLLVNLNIPKVDIIGVSLGASIGYFFGRRYPSLVKRMVLTGAIVEVNRFLRATIGLGTLVTKVIGYHNFYKLSVWVLLPKFRQSSTRKLFNEDAKNLSKKEFSLWLKCIRQFRHDLNPISKTSFDINCLLLMGEKDYFFLRAQRNFIREHINIHLRLIRGSGHVVYLERPNEFTRECLSFLSKDEISPSIIGDNSIGGISIEEAKLFYDFKLNAVKEAGASLHKVISTSVTIIGAIIGYAFIHKNGEIDIEILEVLVKIIISIAICTILIVLAIIYGIYKGVKAIEHLLRISSPILYEQSKISSFAKRGSNVILFVGISIIAVMLALIISIRPLI